jgi:hypothetical protein
MSAAAANLNPAQDLLSLAYPWGHLESGFAICTPNKLVESG